MTSFNRRDFLKTGVKTGVAASVLAGMAVPHVHAAEANTINIALVGCGGRGRGAGYQALSVPDCGPIKVVAAADAFEGHARGFADMIKNDKPDQFDIPNDQIFGGLDSFKKAIDCLEPGKDAVLLASPPAFRPLHFEYAINRGVHVFMEKSFAVDGPGYRRVKAAWNLSKEKGLKVMTGLNNRKYLPTEETVKAIQDGMIGDILAIYVYRLHGPIGCGGRGDSSPLQHQLRNMNCFNWLFGSQNLDWAIHNIDISCWAKKEHPVWVQGSGGRQVRTDPDDSWDHLVNEYMFEDGTRMHVTVRQIPNTWSSFRAVLHGSKGMAILGEGIGNPQIFKGYSVHSGLAWQPSSRGNDSYQEEHNRLFKAIREDGPSEDVEFCLNSVMTGIMGRMAMESGQEVSWGDAVNSNYELCPNIDNLTLDSDAPTMPDENERYAISMPGITKRF